MPREVFRQLKRADAELQRGFEGSRADLADERRRLRINLLRRHLDSGLDSLRTRHAKGASGQESVQAHATFIDRFLKQLFALASGAARADGLQPTPTVLVALGGYGRGELHPSSDIDVMVIYDGELSPFVHRVTLEVLYTLWDLGLSVGHSCRSLPDCVAIARTDFPSRTSMQGARYLAGDRRLFQRFRKVLRENIFRKDFTGFLQTALVERDQRYRKFGASPYLGEPNIKESAGGLRDIHTALWLAAAKFGARTLRELADKGLITRREERSAEEALTFLWRVRNELHFLSRHKNDVLSRDLQPQIARNLGYLDDATSLAVEKFMREYYLHARVIHRLSRRLIARCQELLSRRGSVQRGLRQAALADGLSFFEGRLHPAEADGQAFREDPSRLMKVFWHAHRLGCELSIDLERAVEESLDLIEESFQRSPEVRDLLLAICRNWGRVAQILREMHELGVLGRYLPEWGALTCLVQYDVYHRFSADQHSLLAIEALESLAPASTESEGIARVVTEVEKPELLLLGMLLHDIGKAKGHTHAAKGVPLIKELTARLGLAPRDADTVIFLVEHHLLMSHVAQRRDIDDPKTVEQFAQAVRDPEWLRMLYLLTYADMKAVGPGVLTTWRAAILWELYCRTMLRLTGGQPELPARESVANRVWTELGGEATREEVDTHLAWMSERYLATTGAQRMAAHLRLFHRLRSEPVATELFHHPDLGFSDLVVVTRDLPGLFSLIAGTLAANGINILSAQIHTRLDGIALDTFQVNDPSGDAVTGERRWSRTLEDLRRVIQSEQTVEALLARRPVSRREEESVPGPAKVTLDNQLSDTHTVVEVKCPDRVGLLYLITRTLSREDLDIGSARIATEIDQAFDAFYVTDRNGNKVDDPATMDRVREALEEVLVAPL